MFRPQAEPLQVARENRRKALKTLKTGSGHDAV